MAMRKQGKYIDGIYNYCDRWCERCPFTSRCRSFAMEQKMRKRMERKEKENAEYWAAMEKTLGEAIDPAVKESMSMFLDPKKDFPALEPDPEFEADMERRDKFIEAHPLRKRSMDYVELIETFFGKDGDMPPEDVPWRDAWEVIHWYKYFVHVKFARALHGMIDEREDGDWYDEETGEKIEIPSDADGSAKIAIIGIERSISAWSMMREHFPKKDKEIIKMMALLAHVRMLADQTFPKAREFHRPGFDDCNED
jgi:hypothetical protein